MGGADCITALERLIFHWLRNFGYSVACFVAFKDHQPAVGVCLDDQDGGKLQAITPRARPTLEMVKKEISNRDTMFIPVREGGRERRGEGRAEREDWEE